MRKTKAYSSHLKDHRKETFPTSLSSTMMDGLKSSRVFCRLAGLGEVPVTSNDPDIGSKTGESKNQPAALRNHVQAVLTIHVDLIRRALSSLLAVMDDSGRVHEVDNVRIIRSRSELEGKKVFVEAHGWRMSGMSVNCGPRKLWGRITGSSRGFQTEAAPKLGSA